MKCVDRVAMQCQVVLCLHVNTVHQQFWSCVRVVRLTIPPCPALSVHLSIRLTSVHLYCLPSAFVVATSCCVAADRICVTVRCLSVCLSVPFACCSSVRWVCCCGPGGQEISICSGDRRAPSSKPAATARRSAANASNLTLAAGVED